MIVPNYVIGLGINLAVVRQGHGNLTARTLVAAAIAGIVIATYVSAINITVIDQYPRDVPSRSAQFVIAVCVAAVVSVTVAMFIRYNAKPNDASTETPRQCALLDRLPLPKRGPIISLHSEDHYVRVETTKGSDLLLIRLTDAIELAAPTQGIQTHRSHWVATDHVEDYKKSNDAWHVVMSNGQEVPISRSNRQTVIEAGLVPARG